MEKIFEDLRIGKEWTRCYNTKAACEAAIDLYNDGVYYLSNGEAGRPHLTPRYIIRDGKRRYYIHAEYEYYIGTFFAKEDGPYENDEYSRISDEYLEANL